MYAREKLDLVFWKIIHIHTYVHGFIIFKTSSFAFVRTDGRLYLRMSNPGYIFTWPGETSCVTIFKPMRYFKSFLSTHLIFQVTNKLTVYVLLVVRFCRTSLRYENSVNQWRRMHERSELDIYVRTCVPGTIWEQATSKNWEIGTFI